MPILVKKKVNVDSLYKYINSMLLLSVWNTSTLPSVLKIIYKLREIEFR